MYVSSMKSDTGSIFIFMLSKSEKKQMYRHKIEFFFLNETCDLFVPGNIDPSFYTTINGQ